MLGSIIKSPAVASIASACVSFYQRTPSPERYTNEAAANASARKRKLDIERAMLNMVSLRLDGTFLGPSIFSGRWARVPSSVASAKYAGLLSVAKSEQP